MANTIRIKRRANGGQVGAPSSLANAELAYDENGDVLYYGWGTGGTGGTATTSKPIAGPGAFIDRTNDQTVAGIKTFNSSPVAPTPAAGDNSTKVATTAFVTAAQTPAAQAPNYVDAGPASGSTNATPTYRLLVPADIPSLTSAKISDFSSAADARITAQKGAANGLAPLDSTGLIASTYLPSYVDDVLEYANLAGFPSTGETGKIYTAKDTNKIYRWSGSAYIEISGSPGSTDAVPEGSTNLYFTQSRVLATPFSGYAVGANTALSATDTVLTGVQKLQGQVSARLQSANNLSDLASASTARTNLGLGTMAVQNASAVAITGGTVDGVTFDGGSF